MKKSFVFIIRRLWRIFFLLIILMIIFNCYPHSTSSLLYTSRLRTQNISINHLVKFRNLSVLINNCEQMTTIQCLDYLHNNQSDYFQSLSSIELNSFQNLYCKNKKKMLFHTFWNNPNTLDDPLLVLHIQSHLYTQNRQCSYLIIWTLPPLYGDIDPKYNVHKPYLQFRTLLPFANQLRQVGIDIESYWFWLPGQRSLSKMVALSDAVRFIVLHKLGGMYIDADILLLRDLQPFYPHEFAYRWSTLNEFNTAILRLYPKSDISTILIDLAHQNQSPSIFFPLSIRSYLHPITLNRLPFTFFDPLWLAADNADQKAIKQWKLTNHARHTFESVFRKQSELSKEGRTVFNGAFAFHWHSLHKVGIFEEGSYLYQWNQFLENQLLENI